jgi:hypothetical protein
MKTIRKRAIALGVAGVIALGTAAPGFAGPVPSNTAEIKQAVSTDVVDVRRRWRRGAPFAALAFGMIGAIAAAAAADAYWDRHYRYYPGPYAYGPYPYGPHFYGPYPYGGRW